MQDLREKLLAAGLVSETQKERADAQSARKASVRPGAPPKRRRRRKSATLAPGENGSDDAPNAGILEAIEAHRLRGDTRGDEEFNFELRDGRLRKLLLTREVAHGLASGRFAIVEWGEPNRHIIVEKAAVDTIRHADAEAIRFYQQQAQQVAKAV